MTIARGVNNINALLLGCCWASFDFIIGKRIL
jgi:hypothetical protein